MEKKKKKATKCCLLLKCFGKGRSKAKVEPLRHYPVRGAENGSVMPFIVPPPPPPPMVYPPPQAMPSFATPIPYPPPNFGAPPPSPPYFQLRQTQFPHTVNSRFHYQHHH